MNTPTESADKLFELELRIAQRADELVRLFGIDPTQALNQWRRAEHEVWSDEEPHTKELVHH